MLLALVKIPTSKGMMHGKFFLHKVESAKTMTLPLRVVATGRADYHIQRFTALCKQRTPLGGVFERGKALTESVYELVAKFTKTTNK